MSVQDTIKKFLESVLKDLGNQNSKVPVSQFRVEVDGFGGRLYAPDWFKYMITGRGPGKFPPPDAMVKSVQNNPDWLSNARTVYKYITEQGLAFLIGRKISREGTDIYQGKRKGVDLLGAMEKNTPDLLSELIKNELVKIQTSLHQRI